MSTLTDKPTEELILTKVANSQATVADLKNAGAWERLKLINAGVVGIGVVIRNHRTLRRPLVGNLLF